MSRQNEDELANVFGRNVRRYLELTRRSQTELANKTGLTKACISLVLDGKREPLLSTAIKISEALWVPLDELVKP